jgi:hypothetical protein
VRGQKLTLPARFHTLDSMAKPALGRGLGALLGNTSYPKGPAPVPAAPSGQQPTEPVPLETRVRKVPVRDLQPCPFQPRKDFRPKV